jgi:hypothetical protein
LHKEIPDADRGKAVPTDATPTPDWAKGELFRRNRPKWCVDHAVDAFPQKKAS